MSKIGDVHRYYYLCKFEKSKFVLTSHSFKTKKSAIKFIEDDPQYFQYFIIEGYFSVDFYKKERDAWHESLKNIPIFSKVT